MKLIKKYFSDIAEKQTNQFHKLLELYPKINSKVNLISRKDISNIELHHILHSLSIAKFINFQTGENIADFGTGGGFPGIPLAIIFPQSNFFLIDSIKKKTDAVKNITNILKLNNVYILRQRMEKIDTKFDYVIGRAIGKLKAVWNLTNKNINKGLIYLKGGNFNEIKKECEEIKQNYKIVSVYKLLPELFFDSKFLVYISSREN